MQGLHLGQMEAAAQGTQLKGQGVGQGGGGGGGGGGVRVSASQP